MTINLFKYSSTSTFIPVANKVWPYAALASLFFTVIGLYISFFIAPTDFQQGEAYRIIFIHVPAAWMSMFIYLIMAFWSLVGLIYKTKLSHLMSVSLAPTGAIFTFIALVTGSLWGKPMWGTYWVWDARLTSELILFFLYIGYMALFNSFDNITKGFKISALFAIVSAINIPIIYFSVKWWNTLHQGSSISFTKSPSMATTMLIGMLLMAISFWLYTIAVSFYRLSVNVMELEYEEKIINKASE